MDTWSASTADVLQLGLPFFMMDSRKSRPPALATASAVCGLPSTAALMAAAAADATLVQDPYTAARLRGTPCKPRECLHP